MAQNIVFELDSNVYSKESIVKCLYWYSNDFTISIKLVNESYNVSLKPFTELQENKVSEVTKKLNREFIDYNLRDIVKKETNTIRELIIAKAFSNGEFDEEPKGDLMDPLGIKFL